CDGDTLWIRRQIGQVLELAKVDMRRVVAAQHAGAGVGVAPAAMTMPIGGLPKMVESLEQSFDFGAPSNTQISKVPMIALVGTWKPARLATLWPEAKAAVDAGEPIDLKRLPENLPDHVVLFLGQADLFPYRIEYRRTGDGDVSGATFSSAHRAIVVMKLHEIR